jgi:ParB family chromosome partitioning protein
MEAASLTQSIGLEQIIDTGNIRSVANYGPNDKGEYPPAIIELAESIKSIGQIQPIVLKELEPVDGVKRYELIAGFRRRAAFEYLRSKGDDFNRINATILTGEKSVIQLVENIQRVDLSSREREAGICQLLASGMKQTEIALKLSKSKAYISIHVAANRMRKLAEDAGIDTSEIESTTFSELLSIPEKDLIKVIHNLVILGSTRTVASTLARDYKRPRPETPAPVENAPPPPQIETAQPDVAVDTEKPEPPPLSTTLNDKPEPPPEKPEAKKPAPIKEPLEAEHLIVDLNMVLTIILDYANKHEGEKKEAAEDILALIQNEANLKHE